MRFFGFLIGAIALLGAQSLCSRENSLFKRDIISIGDLSKEDIELILDVAEEMKTLPQSDLLKGSILATCFFEPSTRTRLSFESAMHRLGGSVIGFADPTSTSAKKGESLQDTVKTVSCFADLIVIRHPEAGSAKTAALVSDRPIINGGDGANEHPTQALLDLFTIRECQGKIDGLKIAFVGDLKYGRTVHSLSSALSHYDVEFYFISPKSLSIPDFVREELEQKGIRYTVSDSIEEVISDVDILYMTRIQKERFSDREVMTDNPCILKYSYLERAKDNLRILHPLPKIDEIEPIIDSTPYAYYFEEVANGIPIRMALLYLLLKDDRS